MFAPASPDWARIVPKTRAAVVNDRCEASATDRQRALSLKRNAPSCYIFVLMRGPSGDRESIGPIARIAAIVGNVTIFRQLVFHGRRETLRLLVEQSIAQA